ncbi:DUF484 family protein [Pelistega sp. NLN82]|uniref:DUF484 family protein n=1 Tax=Pelistega ratti TaxID=2652177 RepID=A0A6L9Y9F1_9BURK|nr:DUF484 family protein [Pelistega ratti]NEN76477.1 DUF484 family protein [Pelistega ratti]
MTDTLFNAQSIAEFLRQNPNFLIEHADVFAEIRVPDPNGSGTLSLLERQVTTLRQQLKNNQAELQALGHIAYENQGINDTITDWCASLLAQKEEELLPAAIVTGLQDAFPDLEVELILWGLERLESYQVEDNKEVQDYIQSLSIPYTGKKVHQGITAWLSETPASIAVIPIYVNDNTVGALIFGSKDNSHFYEGMGTLFLETLGFLTSAAISRLAPSLMEEDYPDDETQDSEEPITEEDLKTSSEEKADDDYPELNPA